MLEFDVPNLDATTPEELEAFRGTCQALSEYAKHKAEAMRQRTAGTITGALLRERWCEALYKQLPEWAQW